MEKLLTILISFYNVECFISSCIAMLKAQTCTDFCVILVDDGSTDGGYKKCLEVIDGDGRFSIIRHERNKGLGSGRITGIEHTQTDYLTFIDPDDYLAPDAVEHYLADIEATAADYIIYDYLTSNGGKNTMVTDDCQTANDLFATKSSLIPHVWHKVVKTDLYKRFDYSFLSEISFAEDLFNSINCFLNTDNIAVIHRAYYTYIYNSNSLVHKRTEKSIRENIAVSKKLLFTPSLKDNPLIQNYIADDSFYSFGQLIFPNLRNDFQKRPHFTDWRNINTECPIVIPPAASVFVRMYLFFIKAHIDFFAYVLWGVLYVKEVLRR